MTALCVSEAQILARWALSRTQTPHPAFPVKGVNDFTSLSSACAFNADGRTRGGEVIPQKWHQSNKLGMSMKIHAVTLQLRDNNDRASGCAGIKPGRWTGALLSSTVNNWVLTEWVLQPGQEGIPLVPSFVHIPTSEKKNVLFMKLKMVCAVTEAVSFVLYKRRGWLLRKVCTLALHVWTWGFFFNTSSIRICNDWRTQNPLQSSSLIHVR